MRHLVSLLLGLIAVPVLWLLIGLGEARQMDAVNRYLAVDRVAELALPIALLAGAGVVFGLLATTRISPVGPAIAGLLLVGACVTLLVSPGLLRSVPQFGLLGVGSGRFLTQPAFPSVGIVLGVVLLTALFSPTRWRAKPKVGQSALASGGSGLPASAEASGLPAGGPGAEGAPASPPQGARHGLGLLAGVPVGVVAWVLIGFGLHQQIAIWPLLLYRAGAANAETAGQLALGAGALFVASLLIGLIASTRTSPLGPAVAGLLFLVGYGYFMWNPILPAAASFRLLDLESRRIITTPSLLGVSLIIGVGLLLALASPSRWRKEPKLEAPLDTFAGESAVQIGSPTPAGARQPYGAEEPTLVAPGRGSAESAALSDEPTVTTGAATDETTRLAPATGDATDQTTRLAPATGGAGLAEAPATPGEAPAGGPPAPASPAVPSSPPVASSPPPPDPPAAPQPAQPQPAQPQPAQPQPPQPQPPQPQPAQPQPGAVLWPDPPSTQRAEPGPGADSDSERTARLPGRDHGNAPNPGAPDLGTPGPSGGQNPWADPPTRR